MKKTLFVMLLLVGAMAMFVGLAADASEKQPLSAIDVTKNISDEWKASGKVFSVSSAPQVARGIGCGKCHDGYAFANFEYYNENSDDLVAKYAAGDIHPKGIDCQACHTGFGKELMEKGTVDVLFTDQTINAGVSASCVFCHNGNRDVESLYAQSKAGKLGRLSYPHYGMQATVWTGLGGMEMEGATFRTSPTHAQVGCVDCHMPVTNDGYMEHSFAMNEQYINQTCGSCHIGIDTYNYNNVQAEIKEMLAAVKEVVLELSGAAELGAGGGQFIFRDADGNTMAAADIPHEAYVGAYNWRTVYYDGSYGVHNPAYAKSLLQETYKYMTGETLR